MDEVKNKIDLGGRPPIYATPEEFESKIKEYVESCNGEYLKDDDGSLMTDKYGNPITTGETPTVSGLAYYLGFESRQSMYDYEKREGFSYITRRAKLFIEKSYEGDLRTPGISPSGPQFALKNMGWSDKTELEHSGAIGDGKTRAEKRARIAEIEERLKG